MGGGGGRSTKIKYEAPKPDRSFEKYLKYQMEQDKIAEQRRTNEEAARKAAADARTSSATQNLGSFANSLQDQLRSGLISFADAQTQLQGYGAQYELAPGSTAQYNQQLTNLYSTEIRPGRQLTGTKAAYEELLGRQATPEELAKAQERFGSGYYTSVQDLKDSLLKGSEYTDKFNKSYLDNYYDTQFGKQLKDEEGKLTGRRTFKFNQAYLPTFAKDLSDKTGTTLPDFGDFTGTPAELEEYQQSLRQSRQYLYSAGLTNLQGEIDKELQTIKTEGQKEVIRISKEGDIYQSLVSSFSF
jgi:hypothetical protein